MIIFSFNIGAFLMLRYKSYGDVFFRCNNFSYQAYVYISGQDNYGKVAVLTKLLGLRILPFAGKCRDCRICSLSFEQKDKERICILCNKDLYVDASCATCCDTNTHERPWRPIKVTYSSSPVPFYGVRTDTSSSSFFSDLTSENDTLSLEDKFLNVCNFSCSPEQVSSTSAPSTDVREGFSRNNMPDGSNATFDASSKKFSIDQLKDMIDKKFSMNNSEVEERRREAIMKIFQNEDLDPDIEEVPIEEIELNQSSLKVGVEC